MKSNLQNKDENLDHPRLLIFIVAYNAENTITEVLTRIPAELMSGYRVEVLVIDDASRDGTFEKGLEFKWAEKLPFPLTILYNPVNQGYGGNQKIGYHYAIKNNFDYVALLHGDGQYAPECLPELMDGFSNQDVNAVFGSRMMSRWGALKGGMPFYKYVGNKILTAIENKALGSSLSEFHSGYRIYSVNALRHIPFDLNTNDFHFDTEIIIQFTLAKYLIREIPIPTYYGNEICHVNGIKYALDVLGCVVRMRAQKLNIFYDRKYDISTDNEPISTYQLKSNCISPHSLTFEYLNPKNSVLDLGCAGGYVGISLKKVGMYVVGVDRVPLSSQCELDDFILYNLEDGPPILDYTKYSHILLLDVIEHLPNPELFVSQLYCRLNQNHELLVSTGNIGFIITRVMLLFGQFNYGKKGILDLTHKRLFTFSSLKHLFEQSNYEIKKVIGVPVPFLLALGDTWFSKLLNFINISLIKVFPRLFSYQMYMIIKPKPSLEDLLNSAVEVSSSRQKNIMRY